MTEEETKTQSPDELRLGIELSPTPWAVGMQVWTRRACYVVSEVHLGDYMILTRKDVA